MKGYGKISISKLKNGEDSYLYSLSRYSIIVPTDKNVVQSNLSFVVEPIVYKGRTRITDFTIGTINSGVFTNSVNQSDKTITISAVANTILPDVGTIEIPITINDIDNGEMIQVLSYSCNNKGDQGIPGEKGEKGEDGNDGISAKLVSVTASSQIFKADTDSDTYTPDYIVITPKFQNCNYSSWQCSVNGGTTWSSVSGLNGITIETINNVQNCIKILKTSTLFDTSRALSFRVLSDVSGIVDTITIAKLKDGGTGAKGDKGEKGDSVKLANITSNDQFFKSQLNGKSYRPSNIILTPELQNCEFSKWQYSITPDDNNSWVDVVSGSNGLTVSSTKKTLTISSSSALYTDDNDSITFKLLTNDSSIYDFMSVPRIKNGIGYTIHLSNESHTFAGNVSNALAENVSTDISGFLNTTQLPTKVKKIGNTSISDSVLEATDVSTPYSGLTVDISGNNSNYTTLTFKATESMTVRNGIVEIEIELDSKTFTKKFSFSVAHKGATGEKGDTGDGIEDVTEYYLACSQSSGITVDDSRWVPYVVSMTSTDKYLWNKEVITYESGRTVVAGPRMIGVYGDKGNTGSTGVGISSITNYYLASSSYQGITIETSGWTTTPQMVSADKKYLWTYEIITYTDSTDSNPHVHTSQPVIIGAYGDKGDNGRGIADTEIRYQKNSSGVTEPTGDNWTENIPTVEQNEFLWTRTRIIYSDGSTIDSYSVARMGVDGNNGQTTYVHIKYSNDGGLTFTSNDGETVGDYIGIKTDFDPNPSISVSDYTWSKTKGNKGDTGASGYGYTVLLSNESHLFRANVSSPIAGETATSSVIAYKNSTSMPSAITSINGLSVTGDESLTTGGLTFQVANNGTINTTFTVTTTSNTPAKGSIPIVITVDGRTFTKYFSFTLSYKGQTGESSKLITITPSSTVFKSTDGGVVYTPSTITLTPTFQGGLSYSKWQYLNTDDEWVDIVSGNTGFIISNNVLTIDQESCTIFTDDVTAISFKCLSNNTSHFAVITICKLCDITDMNIIGQNLLRQSANFYNWNASNDKAIVVDDVAVLSASDLTEDENTSIDGIFGYEGELELNGDKIVISIYVKSYNWDEIEAGNYTGLQGIGISLSTFDENGQRGNYKFMRCSDSNWFEPVTLVNDEWIRIISKPIILTSSFFSSGTSVSEISTYKAQFHLIRNGTIHFKKGKIEYGKRATTWVPHPEDIPTKLIEIQNSTENIKSDYYNLNAIVRGEIDDNGNIIPNGLLSEIDNLNDLIKGVNEQLDSHSLNIETLIFNWNSIEQNQNGIISQVGEIEKVLDIDNNTGTGLIETLRRTSEIAQTAYNYSQSYEKDGMKIGGMIFDPVEGLSIQTNLDDSTEGMYKTVISGSEFNCFIRNESGAYDTLAFGLSEDLFITKRLKVSNGLDLGSLKFINTEQDRVKGIDIVYAKGE